MISLTSPVRTRAHDWPAGAKLAALCLSTAGLMTLESPAAQLAAMAATLILYALPGRVFLISGLQKLRPLWPFLLIVGLWHVIEGSHRQGAAIVLRMMTAVALANLVTMTTRLSDMADVVAWLATPLRRIGLPTRALEIAVAMAMRMTPVLLAKAQSLSQAWRARSRRRPGWRIVLPFTLLVLDDAENLSDALRARGGIITTKEN
ncbi:energy-coupling factor transporter transmembrane component T family protein [Paracoccus sp. (in: a-proteobacteria)]|uniref:energy-coupling factor transporter transmembrane component T family protein n=1 Tax=Paracoccus sp. TaxID=267 RepID=UPI003A84E0BD